MSNKAAIMKSFICRLEMPSTCGDGQVERCGRFGERLGKSLIKLLIDFP